jgi:hypothetical protein
MKGPWWTPSGSFRDLVTLILVVGFTWGFVAGRIPSDQFTIAVMGALGLNGVMRQADKARGEDWQGKPPPEPPPPPPSSPPPGGPQGKG